MLIFMKILKKQCWVDIHPVYMRLRTYHLCLFVIFSHVSSKPLSLNPQQGRAQLANTGEKWSKYETWFRGNPTGAIPATTLSAAVFSKYWPIIKKEVSLQPSREKNTERFLSAHLACLLPREVFRKAKSALFVLLGWGGGRVKEDKKDKLLSISRGLIKGKNCQKKKTQ